MTNKVTFLIVIGLWNTSCHGNSEWQVVIDDKFYEEWAPVHSEFRNIVMSLVATLWNVYICIREWKLHHHKVVSWGPEGRCQYSKMFSWELEGRYRCTKSLAIVPFWLSMEHPWKVIVPFWLLTDQVVYSQLCLSRIRRSRIIAYVEGLFKSSCLYFLLVLPPHK